MRDGYPAPIDHFTQGTTGFQQQRSVQCIMRKLLVYLLLEVCGIRVYPFCVKKAASAQGFSAKKSHGLQGQCRATTGG